MSGWSYSVEIVVILLRNWPTITADKNDAEAAVYVDPSGSKSIDNIFTSRLHSSSQKYISAVALD